MMAMRLLVTDPEQAFERGHSRLLLRALESPVAAVLTAERAEAYVTLLHALLVFQRGHELEPLHEDLYRRAAKVRGSEGYSPEQYAQDLAQLEAWGALERMTEVLRIRSYKDKRRERFRYRLSDDAVALLEWLEMRLQARMEGRIKDSRDRLADVLGQLKETVRILDGWRRPQPEGPEEIHERSPESARRAVHLVSAMDEAVHDIACELLSFRGAMLGFASRPYDIETLREILGWLERYLSLYLGRIEALRSEIQERLQLLGQPRYRRALAECHAAVMAELQDMPRALRRGGVVRPADEVVAAQVPFFSAAGRLATLCAHIDDSARAVLRKMHRHVRELERRSARLRDLRACLAELGRLDETPRPELTTFVNAIVGAAHMKLDRRSAAAGERTRPPLPRRQSAAAAPAAIGRPLRAKKSTPEAVRALRAKRETALKEWLEVRVLAGRASVRLSQAVLDQEDDCRRWLDVARARHLGGGRTLARLGVGVTPAEGPMVCLGSGAIGLLSPDAEVKPE